MNLLKLLNTIKPVEETSKQVYKYAMKYGYITGSFAWDVETKESDIDIIISPECPINFDVVIVEYNGIYLHSNADEDNDELMHYATKDFQSCYVLWDTKIYNLLFMRTEEAFNKWKYATDMVGKRCTNKLFKEDIRNKKYRVACFENYLRRYENRRK